jgi:hypothetical protein
MFAPAIVGASMPLSVTPFETCGIAAFEPWRLGGAALARAAPRKSRRGGQMLDTAFEDLLGEPVTPRYRPRRSIGTPGACRWGISASRDGREVAAKALMAGWCTTSQTMLALDRRSERQRSSTGLEARASRGRVCPFGR